MVCEPATVPTTLKPQRSYRRRAGVVRLDAEAQRLVALFTRRPDERHEQERTDAPPLMRRHYADRQLRRLRVDEAVPTVVLGQEAQPCRADR